MIFIDGYAAKRQAKQEFQPEGLKERNPSESKDDRDQPVPK